jgi:hypothetical protein
MYEQHVLAADGRITHYTIYSRILRRVERYRNLRRSSLGAREITRAELIAHRGRAEGDR